MAGQSVDILSELGVGIGETVSEINSVILLLELVLESQGVIMSMCLTDLFLSYPNLLFYSCFGNTEYSSQLDASLSCFFQNTHTLAFLRCKGSQACSTMSYTLTILMILNLTVMPCLVFLTRKKNPNSLLAYTGYVHLCSRHSE